MKKVISGFSAILILFVILAMSCFGSMPTGYTGIKTTFGKVSNDTLEAGFYFKAPWQKVIKMDNRIQKATIEMSCFSSDIQEVSMIYTVNYRIDSDNAMTIYKSIGKNYFDNVIVPSVTEAVKTAVAKYTAEQIIGDRAGLAIQAEKELSDRLSNYNIIVSSTSIEDCDFTDAFTNAVEAKQVAQQNKLKAETEAEQMRIEAKAAADAKVIAAQGEADAKLIEANAEAEANARLNESLTNDILTLKYYEKWNGILPTTVVGENDSAIVIAP